jgi:hypothetical protein
LLAAIALGFILSWFFPQLVALLFQSSPGVDLASARVGVRLLMLVGMAGCVATDRLLAALTQMIVTVGDGDPFIAANALRLRAIGWYLLALQLLEICGGLVGRFFPSMASAAPTDTFSCGGWIAVLMVFVLSRVFAAGSAMRDELEGTV